MAVMALPRRDPDDKFDQWLTFIAGIVCGAVVALFVVWLVIEYLA
jgi:uncharacterized membrane protein YccC